MERTIITISESGKVKNPSGNVWMSEMELVELFGVIAPTLRAAIKAIYKSGTLSATTTQRCDLATPASWVTFCNIKGVITLAFRLNTYEASRIRQKVLESLSQPQKAKINLFLTLKSVKNKYYHDIKQNKQQYNCNNHHKLIIFAIVLQNI